MWRLTFAFAPAAAVIFMMWRFSSGYLKALYAFFRMFAQLVLIGYVLVYIFASDSALFITAILAVMVVASSWIALNTVRTGKKDLFRASFLSVLSGGGVTLAFVTAGVLQLDPWYAPNMIIPLAGMIFASSMTSLSLASERLSAELDNGVALDAARRDSFQAAMIPITNSLLAVGLVSLPGMMTGQILSGVSPLLAVRYQIMVMCMIFSSAGLSTACFLYLTRNAAQFRTRVKTSSGESK